MIAALISFFESFEFDLRDQRQFHDFKDDANAASHRILESHACVRRVEITCRKNRHQIFLNLIAAVHFARASSDPREDLFGYAAIADDVEIFDETTHGFAGVYFAYS